MMLDGEESWRMVRDHKGSFKKNIEGSEGS